MPSPYESYQVIYETYSLKKNRIVLQTNKLNDTIYKRACVDIEAFTIHNLRKSLANSEHHLASHTSSEKQHPFKRSKMKSDGEPSVLLSNDDSECRTDISKASALADYFLPYSRTIMPTSLPVLDHQPLVINYAIFNLS